MMRDISAAIFEARKLEMDAIDCTADNRPLEGLTKSHMATVIRLQALEKSYLELASQFEAYKRAHEKLTSEES